AAHACRVGGCLVATPSRGTRTERRRALSSGDCPSYTRAVRSVATVGRWSMRHPWWAIGVWLSFVAAAVAVGIVAGTESLQNGAVGESARGYTLIDEHRAYTPAREYGYLHSDTLRTADPRFRAAINAVAERMQNGLGGNIETRVAADRHSALVVGTVELFISVDAFRASVLAAGTDHPQITIEETGDISASAARDRVVHRDLHRAELLSIPV